MKLKYISWLWIGMLAFVMAACSDDDDDYQPGFLPAEDCMGVYFGNDNPQDLLVYGEGDDYSVELTVYRRLTDKAASVPVTLESDENVFTMPATVDFEEGEETATLKVEFPELEAQKLSSFTVKIDEAYTDPYTQVDGLSFYSGSVIESELELLSENMKFEFVEIPVTIYSKLYQYKGLNRYRIDNFLNSGKNLLFSVADPNSSGKCAVLPLSGCDVDATYSWYFLGDVTLNISDEYAYYDPYFYGVNGTTYYTYINLEKQTGYFYSSVYYSTESDDSGYLQATVSW